MDELKSDNLTVLICNQIHRFEPVKYRAIKIARCCKAIRDRTKNKELYDACRVIINATSNGRYEDVIEHLTIAEDMYFEGRE